MTHLSTSSLLETSGDFELVASLYMQKNPVNFENLIIFCDLFLIDVKAFHKFLKISLTKKYLVKKVCLVSLGWLASFT